MWRLKRLEESIESPDWVLNITNLEKWLSGYELNKFDPSNAVINVLDPVTETSTETSFDTISELSAIFIPKGPCTADVSFEYFSNTGESENKENQPKEFVKILGLPQDKTVLAPQDGDIKILFSAKYSEDRLIVGLRNISPITAKRTNKYFSAYSVKIKIKSEKGFRPIPNKIGNMSYKAVDHYLCKAYNTSYNVLNPTEIELTGLPVFEERRFVPWEDNAINFESLSLRKNTPEIIKNLENLINKTDTKATEIIATYGKKAKMRGKQFEEEFNSDKEIIQNETNLAKKGVAILKENQDALWSFQFLNEVMLLKFEAEKKFNKWKPFQILFILMSIAKHFEKEEAVTLLNCPTGMGKTESFMGFSLWLAAYERKTKSNYGTCAIIKYPRVMLSKQQAHRAISLFFYANKCLLQTDLDKVPFSVGVLYSLDDTPNRIFNNNGFSTEYTALEKALADTKTRKENPLGFTLEKCPLCKQKVEMAAVRERARIIFSCKNPNCKFNSQAWNPIYSKQLGDLPLYVSDEEVFRYRPTIILTTTFKFSSFSNIGRWKTLLGTNEEKTNSDTLFGHYFYTSEKIKAESFTKKEKLPNWYSGQPIQKIQFSKPSLLIIDETHLITGAQASLLGPIETAFKEIMKNNGKYPQIICSSGTVCKARIGKNQYAYQHHIAQMFGSKLNTITLFPAILEVYREQHPQIQRKLVAFFPSRFTQLFGLEKVSSYILSNRIKESTSRKYQIPIYYFGAKSEMSIARSAALEDRVSKTIKEPNLRSRFYEFSSDIPSAKVWEDLELLEKDTNFPVVLATNTIANGIDSDLFNVMIFNGFPNRNNEYVQARSRIARTPNSLGLAILILARHDLRERSFFENFLGWHDNKEYLYEENPVNKFSEGIVNESIPRLFHVYAFYKGDDPNKPVYLTNEMKNFVEKCLGTNKIDCLQTICDWMISPLDDNRERYEIKQQITKYLNKYKKLLSERKEPVIYDFHDNSMYPNFCLPSVSILQVSKQAKIKLSRRSEKYLQEIFSGDY